MRSSRTGWFLVAVTVVLWASAFPAIRVAVDSFGTASLSFLRIAAAALALLVGCAITEVRRPAREDVSKILLCAATGMAAYQLLLNQGERTVSAGTASLLISTAPIYSVLIARRALREETPGRLWAGLGLALCGSAVVATSTRSGIEVSPGAVVVLAAAVVQGAYHVAQRPLLQRYTAYETVTYSMVAGALMLLPAAPSALGEARSSSGASLAAVLFLALGPSALGFVTWAGAVSRLEVSRPALALNAVPFVAIAVAWLWLGELPTSRALLGGLIGVVGVAAGTRGSRPRHAADGPPFGGPVYASPERALPAHRRVRGSVRASSSDYWSRRPIRLARPPRVQSDYDRVRDREGRPVSQSRGEHPEHRRPSLRLPPRTGGRRRATMPR